jgi:hypothetical protein
MRRFRPGELAWPMGLGMGRSRRQTRSTVDVRERFAGTRRDP